MMRRKYPLTSDGNLGHWNCFTWENLSRKSLSRSLSIILQYRLLQVSAMANFTSCFNTRKSKSGHMLHDSNDQAINLAVGFQCFSNLGTITDYILTFGTNRGVNMNHCKSRGTVIQYRLSITRFLPKWDHKGWTRLMETRQTKQIVLLRAWR